MVVKQVRLGARTYPLVYSSNALYKLEEKTGLPTARLALMMVTRRAGFIVLQQILWAGLEAGRIKTKDTRPPFTVEEVGDLIDEEGGHGVVWAEPSDGTTEALDENDVPYRKQTHEPRALHHVQEVVMAAWMAAFPALRELPTTDPPSPAVSMAGQNA